ncbi:carbon storage regulator [Cytobacillus eiseniae]|uniref:Translational regulator CsrA n=1 Tax=Cytobacillus eiseniae TaxID=762947 RepID=A0ABS4RJJ2_9BACI|nr:carbon storage regulator CsrA [Cytobacillus eiseniae]MBP2241982.1 carbon storage regulator [Cytobacillus eiseniae]
MLVLTRKQMESIIIGDDIEIIVLSIDGEQIKLGINAPNSIEIHRKEVYLSIQEENTVAIKAEKKSLSVISKYFKEKNN